MTGLSERQAAQTESVEYIGRAVAALAADPAVVRHSGRSLAVGDLARAYGFTDSTGASRPPIPSTTELGGQSMRLDAQDAYPRSPDITEWT